MKTNLDRIRKNIETLATFNATPGKGVTRHSFTNEDKQARAYIKEELAKLGAKVWEDGYSSLFGRLEGENPDAPPIMIGSHYDSVTSGGQFDGQAGLVAALETLRVIKDNNIAHYHPIELVAMNDEEGVRFGTGMSNSRAMAGILREEEMDAVKDKNGISLREAIASLGISPDLKKAKREKGSLKAFVELHIEQGPILENCGKDIGLVETIVGLDRYEVTIHGKAGHAGTTPMDSRQDAMVAAAEYTLAVNKAAKEVGHGTVGTIGEIKLFPNASNVIPQQAVLSVDIRSTKEQYIKAVEEKLYAEIARIEAAYNVRVDVVQKMYVSPVDMSPETIHTMESICDELGYSYMRMNSGAGHDAMNMTKITSSNLVFVPSKNGLSHHPDEWTEYEQLQKGVELLLQTVLKLANK